MRRIVLFLAVLTCAATLTIVPLGGVKSSRPDSQPEAEAEMPVSNSAGKAARLDTGAAILANYFISETETAPISRGIAAAARAVIEFGLPQVEPEKPREEPTNILLNDAQIAALKERLELTAKQEQHWPAVETALRAYVMKQYELQKKRPRVVIQPDLESAEVQNLQAAAADLFASLDGRQKARIRVLAGMVGLADIVAKL
jgi:hypothetical protein